MRIHGLGHMMFKNENQVIIISLKFGLRLERFLRKNF